LRYKQEFGVDDAFEEGSKTISRNIVFDTAHSAVWWTFLMFIKSLLPPSSRQKNTLSCDTYLISLNLQNY
jgi:hypothetical protein